LGGKVALVTAGASGIGLAIADRLVARGARVGICDVDANALADVERSRRAAIWGRHADVADAQAAAAFVQASCEELGRIDILVNNAGIAGPAGPIETLDPADWARCFAVNVQGAFHMIGAVVPHLRRAGGGTIVNISTASAVTGLPGRSAYVASKWAIEGLTRNAARELGPDNIRVNALRPGFMDTPRMDDLMRRAADARGIDVADVEADALRFISMRTKIAPSEVGDMAAFLASDAARHVTGQIIGVCGNAEWEG